MEKILQREEKILQQGERLNPGTGRTAPQVKVSGEGFMLLLGREEA
jgi:hypothetical protein